jgi:hypothetical protein
MELACTNREKKKTMEKAQKIYRSYQQFDQSTVLKEQTSNYEYILDQNVCHGT